MPESISVTQMDFFTGGPRARKTAASSAEPARME